jgi:two-component system chemotaxis response regulator CheY
MTSLDGIKILLVDDEPFMRKTIRAVLRAVGRFAVTEADDGDVALIIAAKLQPDVVLCDITMPRLGGLDFVELLRCHTESRMRDIPVIILTGHAERATVIAAAKLRINGYLIKPISPKRLSGQLRSVLARRDVIPAVPGS